MKHLIILLALGFSTPAIAQTVDVPAVAPVVKPDERKAIAQLLSAIHELPPRASFENASTQPWVVLQSLASGNGPIAERAVEAMFMWPNDQTFGVAQAQLADASTKTTRKHRLLILVAKTYGDRATPVVAPFLKDSDAQLRITAAAAIAKIRTDGAFAELDAAIAAEKSELVAAEMQRYARRIR